MTADSKVFDLLNQARTVVLHEAESMSRSGEGFNLLEILRVGHLEARTHTPILAELLNPQGSHRYGATFLRLFLKELDIKDYVVDGATRVRQEYPVPRENGESGGRIDILITNRQEELILIENKIYAGEQANQWRRYLDFARKAKKAYPCHLTLHGDTPQSIDADQAAKIQCVSSAHHITRWLEMCKKEATDSPPVREGIAQYLHLVKRLTQQNQSNRMNQEIVKAVLQKKEHFDAYKALLGADQAIKARIVQRMNDKLTALSDQLNLEFEDGRIDSGIAETGFAFSNRKLKEYKIRIRFEFGKRGNNDFFYGFRDDGKLPEPNRSLLRKEYKKEFVSGDESGTWPAWAYWDAYRRWDADTWWEIYEGDDGGAFYSEVEEIVQKHLTVFDRFLELRKQAAGTRE
jgi:hypothetical protein